MLVSELITLLQTKTQTDEIVIADFNNIYKDNQDVVLISEYENVVYLHNEVLDIETRSEDKKLRISQVITQNEDLLIQLDDKITKLKKLKK
tara:strand:+ start:704 stop:976 length:273 start_codon:yes stop_codon:yes gene_type:complete